VEPVSFTRVPTALFAHIAILCIYLCDHVRRRLASSQSAWLGLLPHSFKDPFFIYFLAILKIGFDYHVASLYSETFFNLSTKVQYSGEIA